MRGKARPGQRSGGSNWRRVRTPGRTLEASLLNRYRLRMHGWCIGAFMMAFMWAVSHTQMVLGVESLAVRYLATLGAGYVAYLLVLRLWAARLVGPPAGDRPRNQDGEGVDPSSGVDVADVAEALHDAGDLAARMARGASGRSPALPRSGGGDFAGAGADGNFGDALGDMAGNALGAAADADEGAVVVVPVVAIFLIGAAVLFGAGALALLYFGFDVLLAVAVELAFSYATARAAMGVERAGWLAAAVRLTWKPLLGALLCAVVLGAALDRFLPEARSLPQAVRMLQGGHR
ncbi:hypothetical protein QRO11_21815 [Paracidovorax citrulli]|uniref:hypothetical protein n=1 Tax=Paracidovorax citrulli TaxID=80869 RepID=UPI00088678B1|nr:hypothetical protein [Paracidovorax citrulli]UMT86615.1 hypothetical protein FRC90_00275 [Paracidovorax citrulli]WIY34549.1 hypothetical protein QRO11_21815 [Paracidovorax citrulli]SDK53122.1 hypothetical protein SAMN04489709_11814 [Paracidovorax citrulli]